MMLKRLFPLRWAKIAAWTGAALAWGTTAIAVASNTSPVVPAEPPALPSALEPPTTTSTTTTTLAPVPELPERGLVVVRYTPVPPPPPQVVTRTVVVAGSSGGGGGSARACRACHACAVGPHAVGTGAEFRIVNRNLFRAMGTTIDVMAPTAGALAETRDLFEAVEATCSRFLHDSELSQLNTAPGAEVRLSPTMARVMHAADTARTITRGLVDAGVGAAVREWGYDVSFEAVDARIERAAPDHAPNAEWSVEGEMLTRSPGTQIDLGGVAKGWTSDLAVDQGHAAIVSAGGDVRSIVPDARVEIVDPWGDIAATLQLGVGALATSSVSRRRWRLRDREANHLIDPRTMEPCSGPVLQASAVTATALEAEAAAKAIVLQGTDGLAWADQQPWIRSALVVWHDGSVFATTGLEMAA